MTTERPLTFGLVVLTLLAGCGSPDESWRLYQDQVIRCYVADSTASCVEYTCRSDSFGGVGCGEDWNYQTCEFHYGELAPLPIPTGCWPDPALHQNRTCEGGGFLRPCRLAGAMP